MKALDLTDKVIEIRVHGVHATPPDEVLGAHDPLPVGGDGSALFLQRPRPVRTDGIGERIVEAFHWGRMTAGSASTAMWLVLAPFGLLNLSRFTLLMDPSASPTREEGRRARQLADFALRTLGLTLTLLLVATVTFAAVDLLAWQCGGTAACTRNAGWLPMAANGGSPYGLRLLVALTGPVALIAMMWWFGRQVHLYPPKTPGQAQPSTHPVSRWASAVGDFGDRRFWYGSLHAPILRAAHTQAAMALLALLIGYSTLHAPDLPLPVWARTSLWWLVLTAGLTLLYAAALVASGWLPEQPQPDPFGRDPIKLPPWLVVFPRVVTGIVLTGTAAVAVVGAWRQVRDRHSNLPAFEFTLDALYVGAAVLLSVLLIAAVWLAHRNPIHPDTPHRFRPLWRGLAAPVLASVSVLLATGFTAGTAIQVARLVGKPSPPEFSCTTPSCTRPAIRLPDVNRVTAAGWGAIVVLVAALVAVGLLVLAVRGIARWIGHHVRRRTDTPAQGPVDGYLAAISSLYGTVDSRLAAKIARSWRLASLKFWAPSVVLALGLAGAVVVAVQSAVAVSQLSAYLAEKLSDRTFRPYLQWSIDDVPHQLVDAGSWLVTGIIAGLIFLGLRAFRTPTWRRSVGILWDLLAFWPRLAHPIVPPPYGGRAVLAVAERTRDVLVDQHARAVVLSGHSQGSLITAATVCYLAANRADYRIPRSGLRLITYGSQLQWAYPRLFPAYIGYARLRQINDGLGKAWYNLHRWTDPLGAPVLAYLAEPPRGRYSGEHKPDRWRTIERTPIVDESPISVDPGSQITAFGTQEFGLRDPMWARPPRNHASADILAHGGYYEDPAYGYLIDRLVTTTGTPDTSSHPAAGPPPAPTTASSVAPARTAAETR